MVRVLKPGGFLLTTLPAGKPCVIKAKCGFDFRVYGRDDLKRLFENENLKIERIELFKRTGKYSCCTIF